MICSTNIVECLRNNKVEPEAFSKNNEGENYQASKALIYSTDNYFHSLIIKTSQWLAVDFKQKVLIFGYTIKSAMSSSNRGWIYNWSLSSSMNNISYKVIHGPIQNLAAEKSYNFEKKFETKFLRIDGNSLYSPDKTVMMFYWVKFFGVLKSNRIECTCKTKKGMNLNLMRMIFVFCS